MAAVSVVASTTANAKWFRLADQDFNIRDVEHWGVAGDDYVCAICRLICADVVQTSCGHLFCRACMTTLLGPSGSAPCPTCKEPLITDTALTPAAFVARKINDATLSCTCCRKWKGKSFEFAKHVNDTCLEVKLLCLRCNGNFLRKDLKQHQFTDCKLHDVVCAHCQLPVCHNQVEAHLKTACTGVTHTCPNGCDDVKRTVAQLKQHAFTCVKATTKCFFCAALVTRQDMPQHLNDASLSGLHFTKVRDEFKTLREQNALMRKALCSLFPHTGAYIVGLEMASKHGFTPRMLKVNDYIDATDSNNEWFLSRIVSIHDDGRTASALIHYLGFSEQAREMVPIPNERDFHMATGRMTYAFNKTFRQTFQPTAPAKFSGGDFKPLREHLQFKSNSFDGLILDRTQFHSQGGWTCCLASARDAPSCAPLVTALMSDS